MAGGKKKSLANKLAKMSDEERARYLQHKADMEEEAKRRKEQLIATFMKKKIRKEDAFSRLNLAKINQNWHQILRRAKCKEMKEDVEYLKVWIERVVDYKNHTISKLLEELEEAEEQYSNNFQYHSIHIDNLIESQLNYFTKLEQQFKEDLSELLNTNDAEMKYFSSNTQESENDLKTIIYKYETEIKYNLREEYEDDLVKYFELEKLLQSRLDNLRSCHGMVCRDLWREIAELVRQYVQRTDFNRLHHAELRRSDAESAVEIAENEERIRQEEFLLEELRKDYDTLVNEREVVIKKRNSDIEEMNSYFVKAKIYLQKQLQLDEKQLCFLSGSAANALGYLEKLSKKGEHIKFLAKNCTKFETERENVAKYLTKIQMCEEHDSEAKGDAALPVLKLSTKLRAGRIKTAAGFEFKRRHIPSTSSQRPATATAGADNVSASSSGSSSCEPRTCGKPKNILDNCCESLEKLEKFWLVFNNAQLSVTQLKEEKRVLEQENNELKDMIRNVLEQVVLSQGIPNASNEPHARIRHVRSAPVRSFSIQKTSMCCTPN